MPSRYEPCGIGQLIAMRYGTIPVARRTGGLADTVLDHQPFEGEGAGFLFSDYTPDALQGCLKRALCVYVNKAKMEKVNPQRNEDEFFMAGFCKEVCRALR